MIRLGVNVDHVATVRNARGGAHPDPVAIAHRAAAAGADGITMHLREDRRHIRDDDLARARAELAVPLNFEMAATAEMVALAETLRPHACCLVPERREEVTTEGGLDAAGREAVLAPLVARLAARGIRVSLFLAPDPAQLRAAHRLGAPVVELHTGAYAHDAPGELDRLAEAARLGTELGLEIHAGHGLTRANVGPVARLPALRELNIGHALIGDAIAFGIADAVARMRAAIEAG